MGEPILQEAVPRGACVAFAWSDGFAAEFASAWLLDNAPSARNAAGQRLRSMQSIVEAGTFQKAAITGDIVRLEFAGETIEWPALDLRARAQRRPSPTERILWPVGMDMSERRAIRYDAYLNDDAALEAALSDVARLGLVRLNGAGLAPEELERTVARFGFIRETNYGRLFDVRVVADPDNLANTARALEPHTDNPYRDPVPTLQLLHCLRNCGESGATFFLDGFALADWFRESHAVDFTRLASRAVPFAFTNMAGEHYATRFPVLRLTVDGDLAGIRLNHRALGAVDLEAAETARWYESYLKLATEAGLPARYLSIDMQPGDIVIFDNERILHGRHAFSGTADRWLRGCYADRDSLCAALARLTRDSKAKPGCWP